jgi:hypothetical protein
MNPLEMTQIAVLGFFTGLGTTMGAEIAKSLIEEVRKRQGHQSNK